MTATLHARQRDSFATLRRLVAERAAGETAARGTHAAAAAEADREVAKARKSIASGRAKAADEIDEAYQQTIADLGTRYAGRQAAAKKARIDTLSAADDRYEKAEEKTTAEFKDRLWTLDSLLEAGEKEADDLRVKTRRFAEGGRKTVRGLWDRVAPHLARVGLTTDDVAFPPDRLPAATVTDPEGKLEKCLEDSESAAERVETAFLPRAIGTAGTVLLGLVAGGVGFGVAAAFVKPLTAELVAVGVALVGGLLLRLLVKLFAKRQVRDRATALGVFQSEAARAARALEDHAEAVFEKQKADVRRRHANDVKRTRDYYEPRLASLETQRDLDRNRAEAEFTDRCERITNDRTLETRTVDAATAKSRAASDAKFDADLAAAEDRFRAKTAAAGGVRDQAAGAVAAAWGAGIATVRATLADLAAAGDAFPPWADVLNAPVATAVVPGVRYGEHRVNLSALPDGDPLDPALRPNPPIDLTVPAFLPFPDKCAVLVKAQDDGRGAAVSLVQAMMLRFLTGLPPGKVRFHIIDPVGRGENFASFMHLADYDEQLVGGRIWTEPGQIEKKLADTTEHMENVIQKYLRNQYASIEDYNRAAGEVAEPYRVLVVANFPTNFTPEAARRLVSIMSSGPACGVCTLVSVDGRAAVPRDFRMADLELAAFNLNMVNGKAVPADADLAAFPLATDVPPDPAAVAALVKKIGAASKSAARVEVPFEYIMPAANEVWTSSAAKGFDVPIGRAGATKKQLLSLGRGTAQHALVAGKTGSGKSTLLHALITNLALMYDPTEAELYLIDFKKGVEFRAYADAKLPHARVIAIESEREFGLSVLQKLDAELRGRGDAFRAAGVNDLAGYRDARPDDKKPRILFIVDEFQEFFVEDDKLAQEAALLLDRLVRQGRAFGLHVLLGSQTLGGAYSLARSTIDQMAVRIALQCSEADAQLILNKDNTAARLLSRPGEAIYNDANGLVEGNDPFQVVWLAEELRENLLTTVRERAAGAYPPPLVFEGNVSAEIAANRQLLRALDTPAGDVKFPSAWVGDAIAIKDPTAATFRQQTGSNVLLIGQDEEAALAATTAMLAGLAAQKVGGITILDGTPDDAAYADYLRSAASAVGRADAVADRSACAQVLADLAAEIDRRQSGGTADRTPRFLVVFGLQRFRELRKADDDYGFGRRGDGPKPPADLFAGILKDGPAVGVHSIVWCDSLTNLNRSLDRQAVREFGMRVLFQMGATDSSHLIDSPAASRLGRNRALFTLEDQERPEKFRPYGLPPLSWLRTIGERVGAG